MDDRMQAGMAEATRLTLAGRLAEATAIIQRTLGRVPISDVQDGSLYLFTANAGGQSLRFMIIKKANGWGVALDACRICGAEGYRQDGQNVICRHCASAIYIPSIGNQGGCNPIGVPSRLDGEDLVIDISSLTQAAKEIPQ